MMLGDHGAEVIHVDPPGGPRWNVERRSPASLPTTRAKMSPPGRAWWAPPRTSTHPSANAWARLTSARGADPQRPVPTALPLVSNFAAFHTATAIVMAL